MNSKPHKLSSCHRHPSQPVTGFCASCLRERLAGIAFSSSPHHDHANNNGNLPRPPQLRRTKSCSGRDALTVSEPHRRSCEVGVKNTLSDLFDLNDESKGCKGRLHFEVGDVGFEIREEELDKVEKRRVFENVVDEGQSDKIFEEEEEGAMTMKEFIDLEWQSWRSNPGRDFKDIAGSLWEATSTFTKRLGKWRRKQKLKKNGDEEGDVGLMGLKSVKKSERGMRETRSEVGNNGLWRRSCDTDPRLSMDAGRMSVDDSRFSFDQPRASWDGCLIGKVSHPRLAPLVSVVEDVKSPTEDCENRKDLPRNGEEQTPGGTAQTRDYYCDTTWQSRRRSLDWSTSHRKQASSEIDELKLISNAKVSPASTELFYGAKLLITERELMEKKIGGVGDTQSGCNGVADANDASHIVIGAYQKRCKKVQKWRKVLNMLGMLQQKTGGGAVENKEGGVSENVADIDELLGSGGSSLANGEAISVSNQLSHRYSVRCGNAGSITGLCSNLSGTKENGVSIKKKQDLLLQRNHSATYSPNNLDNGLLRFYLTPLRSYRRSKSGKSWLKVLYPTATGRNVLQL